MESLTAWFSLVGSLFVVLVGTVGCSDEISERNNAVLITRTVDCRSQDHHGVADDPSPAGDTSQNEMDVPARRASKVVELRRGEPISADHRSAQRMVAIGITDGDLIEVCQHCPEIVDLTIRPGMSGMDNAVSDKSIVYIAQLDDLHELSIVAADRLTDEGMAVLSKCTLLTGLRLDDCKQLSGTGSLQSAGCVALGFIMWA